jgi:vacuolar-type H+-ATPase subunit E/Vma4
VYNEVLDTLKLEDPENTRTTFSQKREEAKAIHSEAKEKYDNDIAQVEERLANAEATVRADLDAATTPIREAEASLIEGRGTEAESGAVEGFNRAYEEVYGPATDNAKRQFTDVAA